MRWLWLALIAGVLVMGGSAMKVPRGIRNNNPGNIRHGRDAWQGMAVDQPDSEFISFVDPRYGIRAMARILASYRSRGLVSINQIITTWAPPVGRDSQGNAYTQNSSAYADHVAKLLGISADVPMSWNVPQLADLVTAIIQHENGQQPYERAVILEGVGMAGVV